MWLWLCLAALVWWLYREMWQKRQGLPPGPIPLPIVGNTLSLDPKDLEGSIRRMKEKYGKTFTWWLGGQAQVTLTDYKMVRELFSSPKTADAFSGRPYIFTFEAFYGDPNAGIVFSRGDKWRDTRRFSMHVLRDFGVGKSFLEDSIRQEGKEMNAYLRDLLEGQPRGNIDPTEPVSICIINVVSRIIFGHPYPRDDEKLNRLRQIISETTEAFGTPGALLLMTIPWLRHIPVMDHFSYDVLQNGARNFWGFIQDEFKTMRPQFDPANEPSCFVEAWWKEAAERKASAKDQGPFDDFQLSRTVVDFWSAGFETTVTTLRWAIVYMTRNPDAQAKVHAELDAFYGDEHSRPTTMEDRLSLPYTQGAINEVQRVANIIPLNIAHCTTRPVEVDGYALPANTVVIPNFGTIMKDPELFPDPEAFKPERFIEGGKLAKVEPFMPFSLGKRMCAGEPLAKMELFILFTMLMRRFKFSASATHGLPSLEPPMGQVRKPKPYTVNAEDRFPGEPF